MNPDTLAPATRQAALLAHGLRPVDRDWLLGRLDPPQRDLLGELLRELQGLRIPPDHGLLQQVLRDHRPAMVLSATERLMALDADGVRALTALLRPEPVPLVARFLRAQPWPWRAGVAAALGVAAQAVPAAAASALDSALVEEVAAALALQRPVLHPIRAHGRWTEIFRRKAAP